MLNNVYIALKPVISRPVIKRWISWVPWYAISVSKFIKCLIIRYSEDIPIPPNNWCATLVGLVDDFGGYTLLPELYVNIMSKFKQSKTRSFKAPAPIRQISMLVNRPFVKKAKIDALIKIIKDQIKQIRAK